MFFRERFLVCFKGNLQLCSRIACEMKLTIEDYADHTAVIGAGCMSSCVAPGSILDCLPARK